MPALSRIPTALSSPSSSCWSSGASRLKCARAQPIGSSCIRATNIGAPFRVDFMNEAILSRSLTVDLTMTPNDKIERMSAILSSILPEYTLEAKKEALDFLKTVKDEVSLNMRM